MGRRLHLGDRVHGLRIWVGQQGQVHVCKLRRILRLHCDSGLRQHRVRF